MWRNWSRLERVESLRLERPRDADEVQAVVARALEEGRRVKAVGAGHSFTGAAVAPDIRVEVDALSGILAVDEAAGRVAFGAGTHLYDLPALLEPTGLALQNMGDIDQQTIAGATSTGTHGTGIGFGGIGTQIVAAKLVTGTGDVLSVSETERPELLPAVRLGVGALGILTEVTLQLVPRYLLQAVERPEPLGAVLDGWDERVRAADHFEFYWHPHTDTAMTKTNTRLPWDAERAPLGRFGRWLDDELLANGVFRAACATGKVVPGIIPGFNRLVEKVSGHRDFTDASPKVFTTNRTVRFREMEYAIPFAEVPMALREIQALIERKRWRVSFPIEVRAAAADENWLSTAHGRETGYLAVHRYFREDHREYFAAVESILRGHDGRPHWGKLHTRTADDLRPTYAHFDDFLAVRDELDPARVFANPYTERVFGR
ncbi:FAD-binding protein [Agromyces sp. MMS17-SY077]|uniref:FAD-binding protein n=1 Tax=Agromyces seonyuensis TaxID=2662446 RepID=A0A6I4NYR6_9MICO|nr:FAD-binding protein [Agromyces seonyuensis]